jgi:hypothetical protein
MTPKARADIHMNLPALQKLDSMLIVGDLFIFFKILVNFLSINWAHNTLLIFCLTGYARFNGEY